MWQFIPTNKEPFLIGSRDWQDYLGAKMPLNLQKASSPWFKMFARFLRHGKGDLSNELKRGVAPNRTLSRDFRVFLKGLFIAPGTRTIRTPNPIWWSNSELSLNVLRLFSIINCCPKSSHLSISTLCISLPKHTFGSSRYPYVFETSIVCRKLRVVEKFGRLNSYPPKLL